MAGKDKGGRETRKPKAEKNRKVKGQTPAPRAGTEVTRINDAGNRGK